ncbi:uncharacterized protein LOC131876722 [Cryptomeria japonica]|uniref:uncharacterized protein LOC131876722 n=1 Tax=Cryptomeria japonica TaxID=3369 RepID=UPI0027D9F98C|nr:uncharacterized protein LOC131876722 [Cryptomeria japonica]
MRQKIDTTGLGYSSFEKGESSKTKDTSPKDKLVSESMKSEENEYENEAQPSDEKEKKKKDDQAVSVLTNTRVTRSTQSKKELEPKVYAKKPTATKKRGKHLILPEEPEETESKENKNLLKETGRKSKPVGEIPKQNIPIDIASFKPMSHFERTMKILKRKQLDDIKDYFDSFDDIQKQEVVQELIIDQDQEIIDKNFVQYFPELSLEELLEMLSKHKGQFHTRARRLSLFEGKIQVVEDDTHQTAKDILRMNEQLKNCHNKLGQTKTGAPLELETEEILLPNEIYTNKDKNDTKSPPIIFFVDDTKDNQGIINTIGTNNEPDKEKEQEPRKGTEEVKEVEKEKDQEKDKELVKTSKEQGNQETNNGHKTSNEDQKQDAIEPSSPKNIVIPDDADELMKLLLEIQAKAKKMKIKKEEVLQTTIDVLSNLLPDVDISGISNPIKQLDILCTSITDQVNTLEETTQVNVEKEYRKKKSAELIKCIDTDRASLVHNKDEISIAMTGGHKILSKALQRSFMHTDAILPTPEMGTLDIMEELAFQLRTQLEITATLLET